MIPPVRVLGWTALGAVAAVLSRGQLSSFTFACIILVLAVISAKSIKPLVFFLVASTPFAIPLVLIHGILNPEFQQDQTFLGILYRSDGLFFALSIYTRLAILLAVAAAWAQVNRDTLFDWLAARRIPVLILGLVAQSIAMVILIEKRGRAVLKAQTARGIPTGPKWRHRISAFPTIILPVITSVINEADQRSSALWSRGFLEYPFAVAVAPFATLEELPWFFIPLLFVVLSQFIS